MTFTLHCMGAELARALDAADAVTNRGIKVPILKATRIEVAAGAASFIATNTDQAITTRIAADGEGVTHLDTDTLLAKVRMLKHDKPVSIEGDDKALTITQGRTKWKVPVLMNTSEMNFPAQVADLADGKSITISADQLLSALKTVQPAFSEDADRYAMMGARPEFLDGKLIMAATDGALLHSIQIPGTYEPLGDMIIPREAIAAAARLFGDSGNVVVTANANAFTIDDGGTRLRSKMIDGVYPNWRRIIPTYEDSARCDCGELIAAVEHATAIAPDSFTSGKYVRVYIEITDDAEITVRADNRNGEEGADYVPAERTGGDYLGAFFSQNLLIALRSFGAVDGITLGYKDGKSKQGNGYPLLITRTLAEGEDLRLVMPILDSKA